jgi:uncharacterized protein
MCIVFDTNVLISAALFPSSVPGICLFRFLHLNKLIYSNSTAEELKEVIYRKKFNRYLTDDEKNRFVGSYIEMSEIVHVTSKVTDCPDPKDNKFLELATDGKADYIVTGDPHLLALHPYRGISIVTPATFLEILST